MSLIQHVAKEHLLRSEWLAQAVFVTSIVTYLLSVVGLIECWYPMGIVGYYVPMVPWWASLILFVWLQRYIASGFVTTAFLPKYYGSGTPLKGRVCVVTGSNVGIGYQTSVQLARLGATLVITCRNRATCDKAVADIAQESGIPKDSIHAVPMELGDFKSIAAAVDEIKGLKLGPIHRLVNNAGFCNPAKKATAQGFEPHCGINFLGTLYFTDLLASELKSGSRVVNLSSFGHRMVKNEAALDAFMEQCTVEGHKKTVAANPRDWDVETAMTIYGFSKLGNLLHAQVIAMESGNGQTFSGVEAVSLHPGFVASEFARSLPGMDKINSIAPLAMLLRGAFCLIAKTPCEGAHTTIECCLAKSVKNGGYFADCSDARKGEYNELALRPEIARRVVDWGRKLIESAK